MRTTIIFLAFVVSQVIAIDRSEDPAYCSSRICGSSNTACANKGTLIHCPLKGPNVLNMTKYIVALTNEFNNLRNDVAGGKYRNLPQAARMAKMSWSDELAWFAHLEVVQCRKHSHQCRTSPEFYYIGIITEEVFRDYGETLRRNFIVMRDIIEYWARDIYAITKKDILYLPSKFEKSTTYMTSLLINERNSRFGCAVINFKANRHFIFSCAFATTNKVGKPIYKWALSPGSKCQSRDGQFTNLCSFEENYDNHESGPSFEPIDEDYTL